MSCKMIMPGSTPTMCFTVDTPLQNVEVLKIVFRQLDQVVLEKDIKDIQLLSDTHLKVIFSQEETLLFAERYDVEIQIRVKYYGGAALVNSNIMSFDVGELFQYEVI